NNNTNSFAAYKKSLNTTPDKNTKKRQNPDNIFTNKKPKKDSDEGSKRTDLINKLKLTNKNIKDIQKEVDKKNFEINNSLLEAEKSELKKRIDKLQREKNKYIKERSSVVLQLIKSGKTLDNLINRRKLIGEEVVQEIKSNNKNKNILNFEELKKKDKKNQNPNTKKDQKGNTKKKYDNVFERFFGWDVDKLGMYYEMKMASKLLPGSRLLNLPCINVCDPEEEVDGRKKTITDKLIDNIRNIFFGDISHVDDFGTFFKEIQIEEIEGETEEKTIKIAPKAPRMKLRGIYSEFGFRIVLNAVSKDYGEFKVYKPPGPFIVTLTFLACKDGEFWKNKDIGKTYDFFKPGVTRFDNTDNDIQSRINDKWEVINSVDRPIDINAKTKEVQNFCVCEPYEYTFKIPMYTAHDGSQEPRKDPGMPFCLPGKPTSDGILSFGCDKQKGGFSPNIAWIVTLTVDPSALQEKIDNTLLANATTNKDEPIDLEDALFFGIEQSKT
ncbi:12251_t:CDS:2, partial [Dentiscutata heterogama]